MADEMMKPDDERELPGGEAFDMELEGSDVEDTEDGGAVVKLQNEQQAAAAREHFANKGVHIDTIHLYGSMELAPLVGLADAIVDLVSTGNTLRANNLVEVESITDISARLIVNQASFKRKRAQLQKILSIWQP